MHARTLVVIMGPDFRYLTQRGSFLTSVCCIVVSCTWWNSVVPSVDSSFDILWPFQYLNLRCDYVLAFLKLFSSLVNSPSSWAGCIAFLLLYFNLTTLVSAFCCLCGVLLQLESWPFTWSLVPDRSMKKQVTKFWKLNRSIMRFGGPSTTKGMRLLKAFQISG